jgi:hypothetical protein
VIEARAPGIPMSPRHFFLRFGLPLRSPRREPVYLFLYQSRVMNGRFAPKAVALKSSLGKIKTHSAIILCPPLSDAAGGLAEDPPCLFVLLAKTIHYHGIRDCSSARKRLSSPSTFGPFAFD